MSYGRAFFTCPAMCAYMYVCCNIYVSDEWKSTSCIIAHKWTMKFHFYESAISISAKALQSKIVWPQRILLKTDRNIVKRSSQM